MKKFKVPVTPAIRFLKESNITFKCHLYDYIDKGGTRQTADELDIDEHLVIKTLIMADENKNLLIILQHGDREVLLKEAARQIGVKKIEPTNQRTAINATGYQFGGTSPFGTKKSLPVYAEESIFSLDKIFINGGKRGFILEMSPKDLKSVMTSKINASF